MCSPQPVGPDARRPRSISAGWALWSTRFGGDRCVSVFAREQLADRLA